MHRSMLSRTGRLAGLLAVLAAPVAQAAPAQPGTDQAMWNAVSAGLAVGLLGVTGSQTLSYGDGKGQMQLFKTLGAGVLAVELLKHGVRETRPDGTGTDSFPSGQTAFAFAAATFFDIRYGSDHPAAVPVMYGLAGLTGVARVVARRHHLQDVIAGGAIGALGAAAFTSPYMRDVNVYPTRDGLGMRYTRMF